MRVTLYTDASHTPETLLGSWAFWARSSNGRIVKSGIFKNGVKDSFCAELGCIINALTVINKYWPSFTSVLIVTDSANSIDLYTKQTNRQKKKYKQFIDLYNALTANKTITFRHQKAHKKLGTSGAWLNRWCDKAAKKAYKGIKHYGVPKK